MNNNKERKETMEQQERGRMMKITEMPGYDKLSDRLEDHNIVFDDRQLRLANKTLAIIDSNVEVFDDVNVNGISCLFAVGEEMIIWLIVNLSTSDETKYLSSGNWVSVWSSQYASEVKHCFNLRANKIGVGKDVSDPWYPVLQDNETMIRLGAQTNIIGYFESLFRGIQILELGGN